MKVIIGGLLFAGAIVLWHVIKCQEADEEAVAGELDGGR